VSRNFRSSNRLQLLIFIGSWIILGVPLANADSPALSLAAQVGSKLFFDVNLSASGKMACATCHDPNHAYAPANGLAVQLGGPNLSLAGTRAVPSLRYKDYTPPYSDLLDNPDGVSPPGPGGGFMQDGRAPTLADQAQLPLLAANEMANASITDVVNKIRGSAYVALFEQAFGSSVFDDTQIAFSDATAALQAYQLEDPSFHPYSSKYDLYAANKIGGTLTAAEARGLAVFSDANRGNCAACHYSGAGVNGSVAVFTDFSYEAIGVPRNNDIPANRQMLGLPVSYDLGICNRADHPPLTSGPFCGMWKTPTLRNVATRSVFFHNGKFKSLTDVIHWYNTRDTNPELWYPIVQGVVQKFDDVPTKFRGNIDTQVPLDGRPAGSQPAMSAQDMQDLEAFLNTLTDGYTPPPTP
jgi:cytochrome c peroxidase